ncbi:hypothetical protein [Paenarthrobacter sp. NPDC018779]|uniref:hypothetical protein n=1 Tax=Paenarthrobacter sp. NPDC018779 TaxID=3364375 RepID=UPI0037C52DD2
MCIYAASHRSLLGDSLVRIRSDGGLIDGATAYQITKWRYRATTFMAVVGLTCLALMKAGIPQSWFTNSLVGLFASSSLLLIVVVNWAESRVRAEKKASYTTLRLGDKQLMQRDPYMGRVIRLAGGEYVDRRRFAEILAATKADALRLSGEQ